MSKTPDTPISVGIVGASGYGGVQLVRLLSQHPAVELTYLGGESSAGKSYDEIYPHLAESTDLKVEPVDLEVIAQRCQVVFLSLPNGLACKMAPAAVGKGL
jgi:N-acetyl-gamma-glutamyl-phosphate reductase